MKSPSFLRSASTTSLVSILLGSMLILASAGAIQAAETWMTRVSGLNINYHEGGVIETSDLGFILAGTAYPDGAPNQAGLAKFDRDGNLLWAANYIQGRAEAIANYSSAAGSGFLFLARDELNANQWIGLINEDGSIQEEVRIDLDVDFAAVSGNVCYLISQDLDVVKLNLDTLTIEWSKGVMHPGGIRVRSAGIHNGSLYVLGWVEDAGGDLDTLIVRMSDQGDLQAARVMGRPGLRDKGRDLDFLDDGSIIIGGDGSGVDSESRYDVWAVKLNSNWTIGWQKMFQRTGTDWCNSISILNDGTIVLGATSRGFSSNGEYDFWAINLKQKGRKVKVRWQKRFWTLERDEAYAQVSTSDGGVVLVADHTTFIDDRGSSLVKVDAEGNVTASDDAGETFACPCMTKTNVVISNTFATINDALSDITTYIPEVDYVPGSSAPVPANLIQGYICN